MITAIVNFKLPPEIDSQKVREWYKGTIPKYQSIKGLVRKYYLFDEQTRIGGGVYLWQSRADADALYTPEFKANLAKRCGAPPEIRFFETPVIVDNETDKASVAAA